MQNCKICEEGTVKYTGEGYWFKCDTCGVTEAYVDYYNYEDELPAIGKAVPNLEEKSHEQSD